MHVFLKILDLVDIVELLSLDKVTADKLNFYTQDYDNALGVTILKLIPFDRRNFS